MLTHEPARELVAPHAAHAHRGKAAKDFHASALSGEARPRSEPFWRSAGLFVRRLRNRLPLLLPERVPYTLRHFGPRLLPPFSPGFFFWGAETGFRRRHAEPPAEHALG